MRREKKLVLEQQVRTLCMLAHATSASIVLLHSLGKLSIAYARAGLTLLALSTIVLLGVILSAQDRACTISVENRRALRQKVHDSHSANTKARRSDLNILIALVMRDTISATVAFSMALASMAALSGIVPQVATITMRVSCVLLIMNYAVDVVLRTWFLAMGAYSACSKRSASLGDNEHHLLRNISTNLQALGTADTLLRG